MRRGLVTVTAAVGLTLVLLPHVAAAQPRTRIEAGGGYSFLSGGEVADGYAGGWFATAGWRFTGWLTIAAETGGNTHRQREGFLTLDAAFRAFLTGPRIIIPLAGLRPFVEAQAGWSRLNLHLVSVLPASEAREDETDPAIQVGAGIDLPAAGRFDVRIAAAYRRVFAVEAMSLTRVTTGLVYRF